MFLGTDKQRLKLLSQKLTLAEAKIQCAEPMCDERANCMFCPDGHGLCDEHGKDLLEAMNTRSAQDRCYWINPTDDIQCCAFITPDEVDDSLRRVMASDCRHAVAHVKGLQEKRSENKASAAGKRRRAEQLRNDPTSLIIDADFVRSAMTTFITPCCGKPFVPFDRVRDCLAMKCAELDGGCGRTFCGICLDKAHVLDPGVGDYHENVRHCGLKSFGRRNVFRSNLGTEQDFEEHYKKIAKKKLRQTIIQKLNASSAEYGPIFEEE